MKSETLEQAAQYYISTEYYDTLKLYPISKHSFIDGAKWQAEKMYSEDELKSAFKIGFNIGYGSPVSELDLKQEHCDKWFEQFKKK